MNIIEPILRQALAHPDREALITGSGVLSYRALLRAVQQAAGRLHAAGVRRHDRIGLEVSGSAAHVVMTLAVAWLGATSAALVTGGRRASQNGPIAQASGLGFVVHEGPAQEAPEYPGLKAVLALADLLNGPDATKVPWVRVAPQELFRIGLSSGTTGAPKPIAFSHGSSILKSQLLRAVFPASAGERIMIRLGVGLPFGLNYWLRALSGGGTALMFPGGSPAQANEAIRKYRVTQLVTSPALAMELLKDAQEPGSPHAEPAPGLEVLNVGGAAMSRRLCEGLKRHICPGLHINYGCAEIGLIALADPELQQADPACAGRLVPWVEAQAVDGEGAPLPAGRSGLLRFRSPGMAAGYANAQPAGTDNAFRDGWFYSGDTGFVSEAGLVHLGARGGDVLNIAGNKVDPARIEALIQQDPAIEECAVLALTDEMGQPLLVAVVVAPQEVDVKALKQRCRTELGRRHVPQVVVHLDKLPRNDAGKVMRAEVRKLVRAQLQPPTVH
jgi:acyl-coenzyme A synthetase/AMP-(fatty) acid ligase